tara:strand:+ start:118 stop:591 length:474 start_codon:yes stop_codon:yes gene_type:complete
MAIHKVDGVDGVNHFPKKFVTLRVRADAGATITKGDWMKIYPTDTENGLGGTATVATNTANGEPLVFGVITETFDNSAGAAQAFKNIKIQTAGKFENANVDVGMTASKCLVVSNAGTPAVGKAQTYVAADIVPHCGFSLGADTAGLGDVIIIDQGLF